MIEKNLLEKLRKHRKEYGFSSIGGFIRYILIKFFEKE